jgi:hypothetical protein
MEPLTYKGRDISGLLKLSGMIYRQGYFTPEEWAQKTGVNPLAWAGFISVRHGFCFWEPTAEKIVRARDEAVNCNWIVLGVSAYGGMTNGVYYQD